MRELRGQVIIVTGASAGIGEATARRLAGQGAKVVLAARRQERLEALTREIASAGGFALPVVTDVTSEADRRRLIEETVSYFGRIDALINNAGYGQRGPIELVPVEAIRQNFETNLFSLIALTQLVIPLMRQQRSGRIINVGSVAGRIARPMSSVYDATKHALEAISDGLRGELAPFGIQVVLIQPGFILTEFVQVANELAKPMSEQAGPYAPFFSNLSRGYERIKKIAGQPDDIARLIVEALKADHPRARYAAPLHAQIALLLKRLLPDRVFDSLLNRQLTATQKS
ncbi:MAG: SDR family NAD(P)-dependent oxidoreductase [Acidobacteriota bacterium]|nr:SDR family NAD(P)-dependent oxidoreductase [Blastocatellia bacterium]MDW8239339.1 SDR family NAD(P)-dependent oxidoreductase [Acidobacteriota bacterium]